MVTPLPSLVAVTSCFNAAFRVPLPMTKGRPRKISCTSLTVTGMPAVKSDTFSAM